MTPEETIRFKGIVRFRDVQNVLSILKQWNCWYLLEPAHPSVDTPRPVDSTTAQHHMETLVQEILREGRGRWSTMIYVQAQELPNIIKVYHPKRAGCGCGHGDGTMITPWWIFSRTPSDGMNQKKREESSERGLRHRVKSWRLFS